MDKENVSYLAYESMVARSELKQKRLTTALVICICVTFISNMAWLIILCK